MPSNNTITIVGGVLLVALTGAVVAMALHGTISGGDALTFLGGIVAIASGIIAHALGVQAGTNATATGAATVQPVPRTGGTT